MTVSAGSAGKPVLSETVSGIVLPLADRGEDFDSGRKRVVPRALGGGDAPRARGSAGTDWWLSPRRASTAAWAAGSRGGGRAPRARRARRCPARPPGEARCWRACIRARNRPCVRRDKARELAERRHICVRGALEEPAAAAGEQRVAAEQHGLSSPIIGDVAGACAPGCRAPKGHAEPGTSTRSPSPKRLRSVRDRLARAARTRAPVIARSSAAIAADVVARGDAWRGSRRGRGPRASRYVDAPGAASPGSTTAALPSRSRITRCSCP